MEWHYLWLLHLLFYIFVLFLYVDTFLDNRSTTKCYIQNITQTSLKPDIWQNPI